MIDKGYLVQSHGNTYDFYEVPMLNNSKNMNNTSLDNSNSNEVTRDVNEMPNAVPVCPLEDIEINNMENFINNKSKNIINPSPILVPKVKEIVITSPKAVGRNRPKTFHTIDY